MRRLLLAWKYTKFVFLFCYYAILHAWASASKSRLIRLVRKNIVFGLAFVYLAVAELLKIVQQLTKSATNIPHQSLTKNFQTYRSYHEKNFHKFVHGGILSVYVLAISGVLIVNIAKTFAGDSSTSWDFSNSNHYVLDDGLELGTNQVRLGAQNYADDASTAGLYHLDETTGPTIVDSSSHGNDGTLIGGSFGQGNLNNAADFDGIFNGVSIPDSPQNSLGQTHTIEAWGKFDNALSPGSTEQRQALIDKGDYSLYFDNESGKLTYELANNNYGSWELSGGRDDHGSWDQNGKRSVNAQVFMDGDLYAGLGIDVGDAEVWKWDGSGWIQIGGDGLNSSWPDQTYEYVYSIETDGSNIFAGLGSGSGDAEVWAWNGASWTKIGGDAINSSWAVNAYQSVASLDFYDGILYAGLGLGRGDAEVWAWNGSTWTQMGGDAINGSWSTNTYESVAALANDGTNLYAAIGSSANDAEVWMWNGSTWAMIGGDSVNSGWTTGYETVRSLHWHGSTLYAGTGDSSGDGEVWAWNGASWTKVGGGGVDGSWGNYEAVYSIYHDGTSLYAGLGTSNGDGEVWKLTAGSWEKIGDGSLNGGWPSQSPDRIYSIVGSGGTVYAGSYDGSYSGYVNSWDGTEWTQIGGQYLNDSWGYYGQGSVEIMFSARGYMYAGLGYSRGSAQVWRGDGTNWTMIGGQGTNGSWSPNVFDRVTSMSTYAGNLVVGLGTGSGDGEVWEWDGADWAKIGGDGLNDGWGNNYDEINSLASYNDILYVGLGNGGSEGEVWAWDGASWTKVGGDGVNGGWTGNYDRAASMAIYNGKLVVGLGSGNGEGEVWEFDGSNWAKIGGDDLNNSWDSNINQIEAMIAYNNKLYAGLGNTAGEAQVWEWDGADWTMIGGEDINSSWYSSTYERTRALTIYNGELYAGLGSSTGDGEVWRWDGINWEKVAGNSVNSSWGNTVEEVESFTVYDGNLYAGTGNSGNSDALVWRWGNNGFLQSDVDNFDTEWHHYAATYDGATMKLYIDGALESSKEIDMTVANSSTRPVLVGQGYAGREQGKPQSHYKGQVDEVRLSTVARDSFTTQPYSSEPEVLSLATSAFNAGTSDYDGFIVSETPDGGSINYRLSADNGTTWEYWNGSSWTESSSTSEANPVGVINSNINQFPTSFYGLKWQAILKGDGIQQPSVESVEISSNSDVTDPDTNASNIQAYKSNGGSSIASNDWTNGASPYFSWDAASDSDSGIKGYCLYLGTDNSADPITTKGLLGNSPSYPGTFCQFMTTDEFIDFSVAGSIATPLTSSASPYYLVIKAIDNAGNLYNNTETFQFRFDNTAPTNPAYITAPSGFINNKETTLTWPIVGAQAPSDSGSGLAGLQYRINNTAWYGDSHSGSGDMSDLLANDGTHTTIETPDFANLNEGINTVYFRTWDNAGNVTSGYATATLKMNTSGAPSEPQSLAATPAYNTSNSFAFDWDPPATFVGDVNNVTYCYTINNLPNDSNCTYTNAGSTNLSSGAYATQPGTNTLYLAAKDESGNINYASYSSINFTANTPAPGIPSSTDIVDVSIKATSKWRLALTWEEPDNTGSGIAAYKIYRSTDNSNFVFVGSSSSTTYIDANLSQQVYYYHVEACDNTNNCGAVSTTVSLLPTGKFTEPAILTSDPQVSNITTKKATISWTTDRTSDSKVAIGTRSGEYGSSEVGNSDQVALHSIDLQNLAAGTTYYLVAKWTDEDGNTGTSQEFTFATAPAPEVKEIETLSVGLTDANIQFISKGATKVNIYYGASDSFGGLKSINTSFAESKYSFNLDGLTDGTKYFYKLSAFDAEGDEYTGNTFSFTTPPRPRINNLRFQPVPGEPTSTQLVSWNTNVLSTSSVNYGKVGTGGADIQNSELKTDHEIKINNLEDDSEYFIIAQSRDGSGNLATSDRQQFRTALDTRPPKISDISIEASIRGTGAEARGQVVVSWTTDEPSKSQVAFAEGSGATVFNSKTAEDGALTTEHLVIVSDLPTSKVYSIQPISRDKANNAGEGEVQSAIIGRATESVLTIILNTLQNVFGL